MFRRRSPISLRKIIVVAAALLACPGVVFAQRHGGGGASAGGGGMNSIGRPTGVDQKDDLKDFHEALAVQATSQQIVDYASMMKSTEAANAELKTFLERLSKENSASELARSITIVQQAIERARTDNKKFLDGFSERQKSGLKEIIKNL